MFPAGDERYRMGGANSRGGRPATGGPAAADEAELAERFWERLRVFATRRLGDAAAAEDVAQETLRRVVEAIRAGRVENMAALPAFVYQTAVNICLHHRRSAGREARAVLRLHQGADPAPGTDALSTLISSERCAAVRRALDRLPQNDRELLKLAYYQRRDAAEIGRQLGITSSAVRVRKHRALRRLSELLDMDAAP